MEQRYIHCDRVLWNLRNSRSRFCDLLVHSAGNDDYHFNDHRLDYCHFDLIDYDHEQHDLDGHEHGDFDDHPHLDDNLSSVDRVDHYHHRDVDNHR